MQACGMQVVGRCCSAAAADRYAAAPLGSTAHPGGVNDAAATHHTQAGVTQVCHAQAAVRLQQAHHHCARPRLLGARVRRLQHRQRRGAGHGLGFGARARLQRLLAGRHEAARVQRGVDAL